MTSARKWYRALVICYNSSLLTLHSLFSILNSSFFTPHFNLYSSFYKILLPFSEHYFWNIWSKKGYLFSSKRGQAFSKIVRTLRLRRSHCMVRLYWQCGKAPITLWLKPFHHAIRCSIAGEKIDEKKSIFQNP